MKAIVTCLFTFLLSTGAAFAQKGLNSNAVFQGNIVPLKDAVVTEVRGGRLASYKLNYYRGISFSVDEELAAKVAALVEADADIASGETEREGDLLTYAMLQLKTSGKTNRYLCYQARRKGEQWKLTLLYLEGAASLEDLCSAFGKE